MISISCSHPWRLSFLEIDHGRQPHYHVLFGLTQWQAGGTCLRHWLLWTLISNWLPVSALPSIKGYCITTGKSIDFSRRACYWPYLTAIELQMFKYLLCRVPTCWSFLASDVGWTVPLQSFPEWEPSNITIRISMLPRLDVERGWLLGTREILTWNWDAWLIPVLARVVCVSFITLDSFNHSFIPVLWTRLTGRNYCHPMEGKCLFHGFVFNLSFEVTHPGLKMWDWICENTGWS